MQTKVFMLLLCVFLLMPLNAQNISVASFSLLENDLTANTQGTIVYDQNGEKCALIKVETTQTGFSFDAGSLGVVKNEQKVGEIWVYVPDGVKRLSIFHQQLGNVRDYDLGTSVQKAKTYLLKLTTGTVTTVVQEAVTSQFLVFKVTPADAMVLVNDEAWKVNEGSARKYVPFGTYNYRVMCQDYFTESGVVTVNDPNNRHEVNVSLKPNYASITLNVENNAEIWVNGERKGLGSWTGILGGGDYVFEARKAGHRAATTRGTIDPANGTRTITLNAPTPIYGKLMVSTLPDDADILIDGVKVGTTPSMIQQVLEGTHQVTVRKNGYKDYTQTITIAEGQTSQMDGEQETGYAAASSLPSSSSEGNKTFTVNGVSFTMIAVEGGSFQMGNKVYYGDYPVHQVMVGNYMIGETEVTQALWIAVMGMKSNLIYWGNDKGLGGDYPAYSISWYDCQLFVRKLNELTGANFRLPTEAEWEYAARGGNKSRGYKYSGSSNIKRVAWYMTNSGWKAHPVKTKRPNELGIYDMSGNVSEWCQDWYGSYSSSSQIDPKGASSGSYRVTRGGSQFSLDGECGVANRDQCPPDLSNLYLGLRLAL